MVTAAHFAAELSTRSRSTVARPASAHLVGVCGAGMRALAELLTGRGWRVTGSDLQLPRRSGDVLLRQGLRLHQGHHPSHLPPDAEVLVYSAAVNAANPERQQADRLGIPQLSYSAMLGRLMRDHTGIVIAGTHGKSTTTAMTGCILTDARLSPSVVMGAELREFQASGWAGTGSHFVVEGCEYQRSFLDLSPQLAAILSIEPDHFDCFADFDETISAFGEFAARVPAGGLLLIPEESQPARAATLGIAAKIETFSLNSTADWWAADLRPRGLGTRFRVFHQGEFFSEIVLRVPGSHNVLNALAACGLCHRAGVSPTAIREGLLEFPGIRRRFEPMGSWRGVSLFDDYAHHPTEVWATLTCARELFPDRKIWGVFQPHQVSRTRALMDEFAQSFGPVDELLLLPIFAARESAGDEATQLSLRLAEGTRTRGVKTRFCASLDHAVSTLDHEVRPGDILITMGAGDIGQIHHAFNRRLQRHHATR